VERPAAIEFVTQTGIPLVSLWRIAGMGRTRFRRLNWKGVGRSVRAGAIIGVAATALIAHGYADQGKRPGSPDFDPTKKGAWRFLDDDLGKLLEQGASAYGKGDYHAAAGHYLAYLYRNGRDTRVVFNLAQCYSRMGNADAAVELLKRAAERGFVHPELLESDEALKPIRETGVFKNHQEQVTSLGERLGRTIGVIGARVNRCRVRLPASRVAGKAYPLVIGLHGNGGNADEMMEALASDAFPGMICAAPEGAYPRDDMSWLPVGHYSWFMLNVDRKLWTALDVPTSDYVLAVVDEVSKTCPVSQVVLLGFSQGVSAAYLAALRRPERVAGVVAFAGLFPAEELTPQEIKAGNRLRILIAHGIVDKQVGMQASERARDALLEAGYRVQFETFEGGHSLPPDVMRRAGAWIRGWL
jgi:phospholipase/carboxylesterase